MPDSPTTVTCARKRVTLTCHRALLSGAHRENSRAAIRECLDAGVNRIEIDVHSLDGDDFIVTHARRLEHETDGTGGLAATTPDAVRALHFKHDPSDRPPLLSEVVAMARGGKTQIQLDLKDWRPMPPERIALLFELVAPVHDRIIISAGEDWNLSRLHAANPSTGIGFDPGHYFDEPSEASEVFLPRTAGAYGYRDEHPLALGRVQDIAPYLEERFAILRMQAPMACEFFLSYSLILRMLDDGFDVVAYLHARGVEVTAWTLDLRGDHQRAAFERLAAIGVDRVTTNTPRAWIDTFGTAAS
jgi:glycerophosphoryl diester phosphodiesterase